MRAPRDTHWALVKRILRYIHGTTAMGLTLTAEPDTSLVAYSDADWAGCPDTRLSTSGYCVYLGPSLISWSSKRRAPRPSIGLWPTPSRSVHGYDNYFRSCSVRSPRRHSSSAITSPRCTFLPTLSITDGRSTSSSTSTSSGSRSHLVMFVFYMCPPVSSSPM